MAVNVIGIGEIGTENADTNSPVGEINDTLQSICDDLSFSMYVEQTTAEIIRQMEIKKGKAVRLFVLFFFFNYSNFFKIKPKLDFRRTI